MVMNRPSPVATASRSHAPQDLQAPPAVQPSARCSARLPGSPGDEWNPVLQPLTTGVLQLTATDGTPGPGEFKLGVREENPNSGTVSERLFVSLPEFDVLADGAHTLSVRLLTEGDINLARMQAEIVGKAQAADYSFTSAGLGIFAVGTLLYLISGRRRKKARTENSRRWGRQ